MVLFICYGMPKSASSFTYKLATSVACINTDQMKLQNLLPDKLKAQFIARHLEKTLQDINNYIPNNEDIYVIKTHCPLDRKVQRMLADGTAKAIVSYRDPYDIVVSLKDAGERERNKELHLQRQYFSQIQSYEDALDKLPYIIETAETWLNYEGILPVSFSKVTNQPLAVVKDIAEYLEIIITHQKAVEIVEFYTSNRSLIPEFNVGIEGRGSKEFSLSNENPVKEMMDKFVVKYLK